MTYSGAAAAKSAREELGQALEALQKDSNIPPDVMSVAQNTAQAVGMLFEAEKAADETAGKAHVKQALGSLSQTLALLQDVRSQHPGTTTATEAIAKVMGVLFPLTSAPSKFPPPGGSMRPPEGGRSVRPAAPAYTGPRQELEANIGANTESNFFVGFSGEIAEGGVFIATYTALERNTPVTVLVTLPGGFETKINGRVLWVRDPMDFTDESEPGIGVQFESLAAETRELILRFIKKRPPIFYDE